MSGIITNLRLCLSKLVADKLVNTKPLILAAVHATVQLCPTSHTHPRLHPHPTSHQTYTHNFLALV